MKKFPFIILSFLLFQTSKAQDSVSVEKSLIGASISPFGSLSFEYENKLSKEWTLLSQAIIDYSYSSARNGYSVRPYIGLEPRWYYNLDRRTRLAKNTKFNTGNYWSLDVDFRPKLVLATNQSNYSLENIVYFLPSYGMRRTISKKLYFDGSFYVGMSYVSGYEYKSALNSEFYSIYNGPYYNFGIKLRIGLNYSTKK